MGLKIWFEDVDQLKSKPQTGLKKNLIKIFIKYT